VMKLHFVQNTTEDRKLLAPELRLKKKPSSDNF